MQNLEFFLILQRDWLMLSNFLSETTKIAGSRIFLILQRVWVYADHTTFCFPNTWHLKMIIFIMNLNFLICKHLKVQQSQDQGFFSDSSKCLIWSGWWSNLDMIIFIMSLYFLFPKNLKLQKSQDLECTLVLWKYKMWSKVLYEASS